MTENRFVPIMRPYFDWLSREFGDLAEESRRSHIEPAIISNAYLEHLSNRQQFRSNVLPTLCNRVTDFWKNNGPLIRQEIARLPGYRARFGAEGGPQVDDKVFERAGLYFHTIIVSDPLLNDVSLGPLFEKSKDFYFVKHAVTLLLMKEVYLADIYPPIAVLDNALPPRVGEQVHSAVMAQTLLDCVMLTNELYDQRFDEFEQVREFYSHFSTAQHAARNITKPDIFYLDENAPLDPISQIEADIHGMNVSLDISQYPVHPGGPNYLLFQLFGQLLNINHILFIASSENANPLISAPVSYHWLVWKMKANSKILSEHLRIPDVLEFGITSALLSKELEWLANVPLHALIELRKRGALDDLRSVLRNQTDALSDAKIDELPRIAGQIDYNISVAFEEHQQSVTELDSRFRTELAITIPTFLLTLAVAVQPLLTPSSPDVANLFSAGVGGASLIEVYRAIADYLREKQTIGNIPIAILWQAKHQGTGNQ